MGTEIAQFISYDIAGVALIRDLLRQKGLAPSHENVNLVRKLNKNKKLFPQINHKKLATFMEAKSSENRQAEMQEVISLLFKEKRRIEAENKSQLAMPEGLAKQGK